MLTREGKSRSFRQNLLLALTLSGVAGAVNVIGLLELGVFVSHMTGAVSRLGEAIGNGRQAAFWSALGLITAFLAGVMTATLFVERARMLRSARYAAALLLQAILLVGYVVTCEVWLPRPAWLVTPLLWTLCFTMGLQNALVTKISGAVVRTTHVTGVVTDLGIELVRLVFLVRQRMRGHGMAEQVRIVTDLARDTELYKARLHLGILLSFLSGSAVGAMLEQSFGQLAMIGPVGVITGLVIYDRVLALSGHDLDEGFNPFVKKHDGTE